MIDDVTGAIERQYDCDEPSDASCHMLRSVGHFGQSVNGRVSTEIVKDLDQLSKRHPIIKGVF